MPVPEPKATEKQPVAETGICPDGTAAEARRAAGVGGRSAKIDALVVRKHHNSIPMDLLFRDAEPAKQPPRQKPTPAPPPVGTTKTRRLVPPPRLERELFERCGSACSGWWAVLVALLAVAGAGVLLWSGGLLPVRLTELLRLPEHSADGLADWQWAAVGGCGAIALLALGGLTQGRVGSAWVLSLFGRYRGTVRRTGLMWISPLMPRRRIDVRLRHWRSDLTLGVVATVLSETTLSFLGFGVQTPDVSLGTMLADGAATITSAPWLFAFPAGLVVLLTVSMTFIGDGLRDALDPTSVTGAAGGRR